MCFQSAYEELKPKTLWKQTPKIECFQSAYEELKQTEDEKAGSHKKSFQSAYEELKQRKLPFVFNLNAVFRVPMRN